MTMVQVAVMGPEGSGKTSLLHLLHKALLDLPGRTADSGFRLLNLNTIEMTTIEINDPVAFAKAVEEHTSLD